MYNRNAQVSREQQVPSNSTSSSASAAEANQIRINGFQQVLERHNVRKHPTTVTNPQVNAISKCLHRTVTNVLHIHPPQNVAEEALIVDTALQIVVRSTCAAIHSTLKISPGI